MINRPSLLILFHLLLCSGTLLAQQADSFAFKVIPLGVRGGLDESNLSAYLLAAGGSDEFICLDAGTIRSGIEKAISNGLFKGTPDAVIRQNIKGYCISHGHLDHLSGLILNSPNDSNKFIYGLPSVIKVLKDKYFTWSSWANFANEGDIPALGKYQYVYLTPGKDTALANTGLNITAYPLSHGNPYQSTAFLIQNKDKYLIYLGDTGADTVEHSNKLHNLWQTIAGLVQQKKLTAIFIEVSFKDEVPDKSLFGHLNSRLLMKEMNDLNKLSGNNLRSVQLFITHMKPCQDCEERIKQELQQENNLHLQLVFPQQGQLNLLY